MRWILIKSEKPAVPKIAVSTVERSKTRIYDDSNTMTVQDIAAIVKLSRRHVSSRIVTRHDFPAPVIRLSQRTRRWDIDQVQAYLTAGKRSAAPSHDSNGPSAPAGRGDR